MNLSMKIRSSDLANPPLKVMILSLEYSPKLSGGVGTHVLEMSRGLGRLGHQVTVLAFTPGQASTLREPNVTVRMVPRSDINYTDKAQLSMVQGILAFNRDLVDLGRTLIADLGQRPDIINYHNWTTFPAAYQLGQIFGLPILGTIHFLSEPTERWWGLTPDPEIVEQERDLFRKADAFIMVSQSMRIIVQSTHQVADDDIHVIRNGLDVRPFMNPSLKSEEIGKLRQTIASSNNRLILYSGRLSPQKGISPLFESAAQVAAKIPEVIYLLAGGPDTRDMVQVIDRLFEQHPILRSKIKMIGKIPRNQLATLYQIADLVVIPSVYDTCPYTALEAMAAGVPVVATDVGGLAEMVVHGQTGLLVPVHPNDTGPHVVDVDELAAAQLTLLSNETMARRMGKTGQQRVLNEFTLERMVESTVQVYRHVISKQTALHHSLNREQVFQKLV
jgi:glycosyltransferase involved in cell wall biosynthesis